MKGLPLDCETSALKTLSNDQFTKSHYQLSWWNQIILLQPLSPLSLTLFYYEMKSKGQLFLNKKDTIHKSANQRTIVGEIWGPGVLAGRFRQELQITSRQTPDDTQHCLLLCQPNLDPKQLSPFINFSFSRRLIYIDSISKHMK